MKTKRILPALFVLMLALTIGPYLVQGAHSAEASPKSAPELISGNPQNVPISGMVTMVDIGAKSCIPCKMMTPIIEELSREYDGKAAIAFIDVWKHPAEAKKYRIRSIPTQIFYDAKGVEQYRHVGFMDKKSIVAMLTKLGVK